MMIAIRTTVKEIADTAITPEETREDLVTSKLAVKAMFWKLSRFSYKIMIGSSIADA